MLFLCPCGTLILDETVQATNDTEFHLLPSQDVSIFLDNTFVMKTSLDSVFPGESFQACLGVDPSVKVRWSPKVSDLMRSTRGSTSYVPARLGQLRGPIAKELLANI